MIKITGTLPRYFLIALLLFFFPAGSVSSQEAAPFFDPQLLQWMRTDVSAPTGMPFSFEVRGDKKEIYGRMGPAMSTTGIIERTIVDQGISIYDTALWQIALSATDAPEDLAMAGKPVEHYWQGNLNDFNNIRSGSGGQIFVYDPASPELVTSSLSQQGRRGFIFRIMNANGRYLSSDPLDGKASYEYFPNNPRIHWEDWKPIAGENAWVVMAALHLLMKKPTEERAEAVELRLAEELARAAIILQAGNGGVRMAPLGTYFHLLDIPPGLSDAQIAQRLDDQAKDVNRQKLEAPAGALREFPAYHRWYYDEIATENNISWYAAFRMLYQVTGKDEYHQSMARIEEYFKSVWDADNGVFYQGAHFTDGAWVSNFDPFAADVQNWSLVVIGPAKIDAWFGEGAAYGIWKATKEFSGVADEQGKLQGVGFTKENDRLSIEWTCGAILGTEKLADYYASSHPSWAQDIEADIQSMRSGIEAYRFKMRDNEAAYSYSSRRGWIPFGWYSHEPGILSLASTAWVFLIDAHINPFEITLPPIEK